MSISFVLIDPSEGWREGETEKEREMVDVATLDTGGQQQCRAFHYPHPAPSLHSVEGLLYRRYNTGVWQHLALMQ